VSQIAAQIDYAPPPAMRRGRGAMRIAIALAALSLLAGAVWVTPRAMRYGEVLYLQSQCMNYSPPAGQVVHATDPAQLPSLLRNGSPYGGSFATGHAFLVPQQYSAFAGRVKTASAFGTAFLHRRRSKSGNERLVAVNLEILKVSPTKSMTFVASVFDPAGFVRGPRDVTTSTTGFGRSVLLAPSDRYVVFAGQPDPSDESHFTIDVTLNGTRHTLDGWLRDDSVRIEQRH
jgi:hypothetical protein